MSLAVGACVHELVKKASTVIASCSDGTGAGAVFYPETRALVCNSNPQKLPRIFSSAMLF